MKTIQRLTSPIVILAATTVLMVPMTSQAFEAKLSGQVSRMLVLPDDAAGDETQFVDIGWSGTRFRFTGSDTAENGITYGFRFEMQARENASDANALNGGTLGDTGDHRDNRYQDLYFSGDFGKVSFGKGDGAANGSAEVDMSGTALASNAAGIVDNFGAYLLATDDPNTVAVEDDVKFGDVFNIQDALSRQNRIRYDTPDFNGFSLAGSLDQGNATELAARYKGDFGGTKFGAAVFFATAADKSATVDGNDISGFSASALLSSGLNFTVAYTQNDADGANADADDRIDREGTFFKVGYKMGMHAFSVDVGDSELIFLDDGSKVESDTVGLTYAVFPHKGVELFATIRELDADFAGAQSVDIIAIGSRIKF